MPWSSPARALAAAAAPYARARADRWAPVPAELDARIAADAALHQAARQARKNLYDVLIQHLRNPQQSHLDAVLAVPRERFVLPEDIAHSADDVPMPLDAEGHATVSAPHAYLLTFGLLDLCPGDCLVELGTGTGYGAALARRIVGPRGRVVTVEIDRSLHQRAARLLADPSTGGGGAPENAPVETLLGDGRELAPVLIAKGMPSGLGRLKIAITYACTSIPEPIERCLPEGGCLVAPVGATEEHQELVRLERRKAVLWQTSHGAVRYVTERTP